ncbi:hypothetical protein AA0474_1206 [Acetobacter lovaniensis NRIC 0474]|nr:hypothetical protein AA0474_1206 [Acetobacter lovaniensis NRIC 0474]
MRAAQQRRATGKNGGHDLTPQTPAPHNTSLRSRNVRPDHAQGPQHGQSREQYKGPCWKSSPLPAHLPRHKGMPKNNSRTPCLPYTGKTGEQPGPNH